VFFRPAHPLCLAAARTILCLQALWILLSRPDLPDLARWPEEFWILAGRFLPLRFGMGLLPPAAEQVLFAVLHGTLLAALFGLRPRAASLASAALLYHFAPFEEAIAGLPHTAFGGLTLPALGLCVLGLAEDPRRLREASPEARWPFALIQLLFVLGYFFPAVAKLRFSGLSWFTAENIRYYALGNATVTGAPLALWVAARPAACAVIAGFTFLLELLSPLVVASAAFAMAFALAALAFHAGIVLVIGYSFPSLPLLLLLLDWDAVGRRFGPVARLSLRRGPETALLFVASVAAALAAGEGLVRLLAPQPLRPAWDDEVDGIRVARAGVRGRHSAPGAFDVDVTTNRQRMRGAHEYGPRGNGATRMAVLGDSIAFGWGVEDGETYPARLEAILNARGPGRVEVVNAGFPGTCLGEKAAWYAIGVRPLAPSVVVLTLLGDDVDGDLYWRVFERDAAGNAVRAAAPGNASARRTRGLFQRLPGYATLAGHSQLLGLVRRTATRLVSRERTTALGQAPASAEEVRRFREEGLPLLAAEIAWLDARVREDGGELVVVFVPFREGVYGDAGWWPDELRWKSREVAEAAADVCRRRGLRFRDVTAALARRAVTAPTPLYHQGAETHPTPAGYGAIAEEVAETIAQSGSR
jgi:lysophospholipase L1-like esterase